jgi:hypothetical protein
MNRFFYLFLTAALALVRIPDSACAAWHGVDLAEYATDRFLVVWSYDGPETDDFALRAAFLDASLPEPELKPFFTINDSYEAQEPPAVVFDPSTGRFLVVWEDGRQYAESEVDIRGALLDEQGEVLLNDIEVDLGPAAQHGPAIVRSGTLALVAYIDERSYATRAADPVSALLDFQGSVVESYLPVSVRGDDEWWPILAAGKTRHLMAWYNGADDTVTGALLTATGEVDQSMVLLSNAYPYEYACTWLEGLNRFLVVSSDGSGSRAVLVDQEGNLFGRVIEGLPQIIRESHLVVRKTDDSSSQVFFPTVGGGVAILSVLLDAIEFESEVSSVFPWTEKGTDGVSIQGNRVLFLATDGEGGVPTLVPLILESQQLSGWRLR